MTLRSPQGNIFALDDDFFGAQADRATRQAGLFPQKQPSDYMANLAINQDLKDRELLLSRQFNSKVAPSDLK